MWQQDGPTLAGHGDWVRDVAWAPNFGLPANTIASAGQDGKVLVWNERAEGALAGAGQGRPSFLGQLRATGRGAFCSRCSSWRRLSERMGSGRDGEAPGREQQRACRAWGVQWDYALLH